MIAFAIAMALTAGACRPGYANPRPPEAYTQAVKRALLPLGASPRDYELDHKMPLCLCGAPYNPQNLQVQPWPEARRKDAEEWALCSAVRDGSMTLPDAQHQMAKDWP